MYINVDSFYANFVHNMGTGPRGRGGVGVGLGVGSREHLSYRACPTGFDITPYKYMPKVLGYTVPLH